MPISVGQGLPNKLWINDGTGVFTDTSSARLPGTANSTFDILLLDVDGDMDLDAFIANATIRNTNVPLLDEVWINDGNGVFTEQKER